MRAKPRERLEARLLRAEGWSLNRIVRELGVSKSSVSVWVRDVAVPPPPEGQRLSRAATPEPPDDSHRRRCSKCEQHLPLSAFNRAGDDHQWWCRECFRAYFRDRGQAHREHVRKNMAVRVACARDFVFALLRQSVCSDCGEGDLATLEFDHVSGKDFGISAAVAAGMRLQRLTAELDRCEIVCANCHRRRTVQRGDHWRCREADAEIRKPRHRQRTLVRQVLTEGRCLDCSEDDLRVLEFDHVRGDKLASIAQLVATEAPLTRLTNEIAKCEIVCANCHRRRTARRAGWKRLSWTPALQ